MEFSSDDRIGTQTMTLMPGYERLKTDENGRYFIDRMPAIKVQPMAWSDAVGPSVPDSLLSDGNTPLVAGATTELPDLYVFPGYTLRGYVRDWKTSEPIAGATVGPRPNVGVLVGKPPQPTVTDANGYYEIHRMAPYSRKAAGEEPATISLEFITASKEGYRESMFNPRITTGFDPDSLVVEHDFRIHQENPSEP